MGSEDAPDDTRGNREVRMTTPESSVRTKFMELIRQAKAASGGSLSKGRMKNSKAAEVLFFQAKQLIDSIVEELSFYNSIADALTEMGYGEEFQPYVPVLGLSSGNMNYDDSGFLDEIRKLGPTRQARIRGDL
jgi:hypothetical protein